MDSIRWYQCGYADPPDLWELTQIRLTYTIFCTAAMFESCMHDAMLCVLCCILLFAAGGPYALHFVLFRVLLYCIEVIVQPASVIHSIALWSRFTFDLL